MAGHVFGAGRACGADTPSIKVTAASKATCFPRAGRWIVDTSAAGQWLAWAGTAVFVTRQALDGRSRPAPPPPLPRRALGRCGARRRGAVHALDLWRDCWGRPTTMGPNNAPPLISLSLCEGRRGAARPSGAGRGGAAPRRPQRKLHAPTYLPSGRDRRVTERSPNS